VHHQIFAVLRKVQIRKLYWIASVSGISDDYFTQFGDLLEIFIRFNESQGESDRFLREKLLERAFLDRTIKKMSVDIILIFVG